MKMNLTPKILLKTAAPLLFQISLSPTSILLLLKILPAPTSIQAPLHSSSPDFSKRHSALVCSSPPDKLRLCSSSSSPGAVRSSYSDFSKLSLRSSFPSAPLFFSFLQSPLPFFFSERRSSSPDFSKRHSALLRSSPLTSCASVLLQELSVFFSRVFSSSTPSANHGHRLARRREQFFVAECFLNFLRAFIIMCS